MTWRFLAGMPWISVWQYPSNKTLVSTICLQLGQYLCPPFRVSIFMSSCLFVLLVGGGQGVLKLDWGQKFSSRWLAGAPRNMQDAIPLASWRIDLGSGSKDLGRRSELRKMKDRNGCSRKRRLICRCGGEYYNNSRSMGRHSALLLFTLIYEKMWG
jgi:hypothetical protein